MVGVSRQRSSTLLSCLGYFIPFSLVFYLRATLGASLVPAALPCRHQEPREPLGHWPRISCFQKGIFWHLWGGMAPGLAGGTDGPWGSGTVGGAGGLCSARLCCEAARDLSGCGTGRIYPSVCEITCAVRGVEPGLLHLPSEPCPRSVPQFPLSQRQHSPRGSSPGVLGLFSICPGMQGRLGVLCQTLQPWCLHPAAGGDGAVPLPPYLPLLVPTMGKSQVWGWG